jgi:hypothetical protein
MVGRDDPFSVSARSVGYTEAQPRWHGVGMVTGPSATPGAWAEHHVQCDHEHRTITAARECGDRLAGVMARRLNREARDHNAVCGCDIMATDISSHGDEPLWLKHCRGHGVWAGPLKGTEAEALAVEWECPWGRCV